MSIFNLNLIVRKNVRICCRSRQTVFFVDIHFNVVYFDMQYFVLLINHEQSVHLIFNLLLVQTRHIEQLN